MPKGADGPTQAFTTINKSLCGCSFFEHSYVEIDGRVHHINGERTGEERGGEERRVCFGNWSSSFGLLLS